MLTVYAILAMAARVGIEPTTYGLTVRRSAAELPGIIQAFREPQLRTRDSTLRAECFHIYVRISEHEFATSCPSSFDDYIGLSPTRHEY